MSQSMDNLDIATKSKLVHDIFRWLRNIYSWLGQALTAWDTLFGIAVALIIPFLTDTPSEALRISGLILQFVGAVIVIVDINGTRKLFGKPGMLASAGLWLKSFPAFRPRPVTASGTATSPPPSASGRAYVKTPFDSNASIADRISELERVVMGLQDVYGQVDSRIDEAKRELTQEIEKERQERIRSEDSARQLLKAAQTDGLHISALGAVWLLVGMVMSTMPDELALIYQWLM